MENQDFVSFLKNFEEKYKDVFSETFQNDEKLRINTLNDFRKNAALRFIPAILVITSLMIMIIMYSVGFFIGIFAIINVFLLIWCSILFHNEYLIFLGLLVVCLTPIKSFGILFAILIPAIICLKLFYNYKEFWNKKFTSIIKSKHMNYLISTFGNIEWLKNKTGILFDDLRASDLFMDFDIRDTDDEFRGNYKGVPFKISETTLYKNADRGHVRGDGSKNSKIFQGIVIDFKIKKTVKNRTIVSTKQNKTSQKVPVLSWVAFLFLGFLIWNAWGLFGKILALVIILPTIYTYFFAEDENFQKVILEDEKFNKIFNVYSSDQIEARYLLTTSFMERFKNLQSSFGAKIIKCSFYNENKLMIAISTDKNLFEIGSLYKSVNDKTFMKQFYKELSSIFFFIDYFKLDENTGL